MPGILQQSALLLYYGVLSARMIRTVAVMDQQNAQKVPSAR
jgi:hypothetical protein